MDITGKPDHVCVVLDDYALVSALKKMAGSGMPVIETSGVCEAKPLHGL